MRFEFYIAFLHSVSRKLVSATHRARLPEKWKKRKHTQTLKLKILLWRGFINVKILAWNVNKSASRLKGTVAPD